MKGFNQVLAVIGGVVLVVALGWAGKAGVNAILQSGYEAHEAKVADELKAGRDATQELADRKNELKTATDKVEELSKQLEATKATSNLEHAALMNSFGALITVKTNNDECEKKFKGTAYEKCAYRDEWFETHRLTVTDGAISIKKKDGGYYGVDLAKYEFVRSADGKVIDFKLVPEKVAAQR